MANSDLIDPRARRFDLESCWPLLAMHVACLAVFAVGISPIAVATAIATMALRTFGLSAGYHRYFSHHSFKTSRAFQFVLACLGASAAQRGPCWWAANHRRHHAFADGPDDPHSPRHGLFWAHMGWLLSNRHVETHWEAVPDLAAFPELRFLDRWPMVAPLALAGGVFMAGVALPGTTGPQLFVWGFVISTVALFHSTFLVTSVGHRFGEQAWETGDDSRNMTTLWWLTLGDGWHNNHHRFPASARHGLEPGQWDPTWWILLGLERLGVVWKLRYPVGLERAKRSQSQSTNSPIPASTQGASPVR